jgi:hypothetical protein
MTLSLKGAPNLEESPSFQLRTIVGACCWRLLELRGLSRRVEKKVVELVKAAIS